jgi:ABC-type dipeptide/oligopeptide/nickel transport system ATPase component
MSARPSRIVVASALAALAWLLSASHPVSAEDWTTSPQIRDLYEKA